MFQDVEMEHGRIKLERAEDQIDGDHIVSQLEKNFILRLLFLICV